MSIPLLANAGPAVAFDAKATDAAFAALLSMPSAKPETGSWNFPVPADYRAEGETGLIAYLEKQQRKGADFNAYRHFGTLLHHAIRAKLTKTAFWLLDHGAGPRKTLLNGTEDALALSVQYKQHDLAKVLRDKYGLTAPKVSPPAQAAILQPSKGRDTLDFNLLRSAVYAIYEDQSKPELSEKSLRALSAWEASVGTIPDDRYAAKMNHDDSLIQLVQAYSRTPGALDKALARFPVVMLQRHSTALVGGLASVSTINLFAGQTQAMYTVPEQSWRVLWRRIGQQVDYTQTLAPPGIWIIPLSTLAGRIQPTLWDELYASGYQEHHAQAALGCLLNTIDAPTFKKLWPTLPKYFPDIREAAPGMLLSGFRFRQADRVGYCQDYIEGLRDKLLLLSSLGIERPVKGIDQSALRYVSNDILAAMAPFIKPTIISTDPPRFVDANPECQFSLTPLVYKMLIDNPVAKDADEATFDVYIESVQLIEVPNTRECGLLVGGFSRIDGYVSGDYDSFTGPDSNPRASCPDPTDRYEIWHERSGKIERHKVDMGGDDGTPLVSLIRDRATGSRHYLNSGEQYGMCHVQSPKRLPYLLAWDKTRTGWALIRYSTPDIVDALYDQCDSEKNGAIHCKGIASLSSEGTADRLVPDHPTAAYVYDLQTFIKTFRKTDYEAYLNAVMSLDKPKLRELHQMGIPGGWTAEAIQKVGESKLSLGEKRKRIAWLFYDHAQLEKALAQYTRYYPGYDVIGSLVSWLPEEDWRPILDIVARHGSSQDYGLGHIRNDVVEHGLKKLACGIDNARGLICGETWSTETADPGQASPE